MWTLWLRIQECLCSKPAHFILSWETAPGFYKRLGEQPRHVPKKASQALSGWLLGGILKRLSEIAYGADSCVELTSAIG